MNKINVSEFIEKAGKSLKSICHLLTVSPHVSRRHSINKKSSMLILGNGPSLNKTLSEYSDAVRQLPLMAVNFAANTPIFSNLQPQYYILADPHFFLNAKSDKNVEKLWGNIRKADWGMTLFVPYNRVKIAKTKVGNHIKIEGFSMTPCEGFDSLCRMIYSAGLGTPRPRNVLIPAIMAAIRSGFGTIYIAGADHTWTRTLEVDEQNHVISVQPHFYEDNDHEKNRVVTEYHAYHLHTILKSLYTAFRSYFDIRRYADHLGVRIVNVTPGSFIDAFERGSLSEVIAAK